MNEFEQRENELKREYIQMIIKEARFILRNAPQSKKNIHLNEPERALFNKLGRTLKEFLSTHEHSVPTREFAEDYLNMSFSTVRRCCFPTEVAFMYRKETLETIVDNSENIAFQHFGVKSHQMI